MTAKIAYLLSVIIWPGSSSKIEPADPVLTKLEVFPAIIAGLLGVLMGLTFQNAMTSTEMDMFMLLDFLILYAVGALILIWISIQFTKYFRAKPVICFFISVFSIIAVCGFILLAQPQGPNLQIRDQLRYPFLMTLTSITALEWLLGHDWEDEYVAWAVLSSAILFAFYTRWS